MATWNQLLNEAARGDTIVAKAPTDESVWDESFHDGYGTAEGKPVLAWSETRVYFPVEYDGSEWIGSAPRDPVKNGQLHVGG